MPESTLNEGQLQRLLQVGRALVSELDLESLLHQVLETAQELTGARYAALGILNSDGTSLERLLDLGIDETTRQEIGILPKGNGVIGELIRHSAPLRLAKVSEHPRSQGFPPGHPYMDAFLGVPIQIRGEIFGNIYLTEKAGTSPFDELDEAMLVTLADWAAVAIDNAKVHERDRLRRTIEASERERKRWAMNLHDQTLQDLGALKVMQEVALTRGDPETMKESLETAASQLEETIAALELLILELRPATLDALGVEAAIETLLSRLKDRCCIRTNLHVDLAFDRADAATPLSDRCESTIYRVVQEALNNAVKHSGATWISVSIVETQELVTLFIEDNGKGFTPADGYGGRFGLDGMGDRVDLVGGDLLIDSAPGSGTRIEAHLPADHSNASPTV